MDKSKTLSCALLLMTITSQGCSESADHPTASEPATQSAVTTLNSPPPALQTLLAEAKRVPTQDGWYEVLKLPNQVYAFWEPGHAELVNSFLILGESKDLLYDTGMGIADLRAAINDVRMVEGLPERELMVVNSHNHLDHNGGNQYFPKVWVANNAWGIEKLASGLPGGEQGGFVAYWDDLRAHPNVAPPTTFNPNSHAIPPYPRDQINLLEDGDVIDLGNRQFSVRRTFAHSPDGIALFDNAAGLFFGGDTFYGAKYLVTDLDLLAQDLRNNQSLPVSWHYASHGAQLIEAMQLGTHLTVVKKMLAGGGSRSATNFAGVELPATHLDGVTVILAPELLVY